MHHGTASAISGASAGLAASIVTCPLDVVKTRLQAQIGPLPARNGAGGAGATGAIQAQAQAQTGAAIRESGKQLAKEAAEIAAGVVAGRSASSVPGEKVVGRGPAVVRAVEAQYQSIPQIMRRIWVEDGFKGFYRGLGPTIFGYLPTWAIYFSVYDTCKDTLASTLHINHGHTEFVNHIVAAMAAGAASTVCTSPLWVVKTRFMLQSAADPSVKRYRHTGDAFVQIWRAEGWRGFYKGLLPSLFGVSHVAVQFPLYEQFKAWARANRRRKLEHERGVASGTASGWRDAVLGTGSASGKGTPAASSSAVSAEEEAALPSGTILVCSSSAKMIASVATYPHEVLRTKLQMQPKSSSISSSSSSAPVASAAGGSAASGPGSGSAGSSRPFSTLRTALVPSAAGGGGSGGAGAGAGLPWHELPPSASVRRRPGALSAIPPSPPSSSSSAASLSSSAILGAPQRGVRGGPISNTTTSSSTSGAANVSCQHHLGGRGAVQAFSGLTDATVHHDEHRHPSGTTSSSGTQGRYTGVIQACRTIAREEGIRGFYRGMTVNLVRTVPNSALTILTYELMMRQLTGSSV
ncbi:hypothetical protein OC842_002581 [Tilletia horrida]|uniref:Mitochondrial carrier n=1 Tax=Tilletia horrida TaxID=155126 RepID=A0AAN6GCV4_9BASI|nr:hypothetical protein OC842_002581 [Tilletia horrida]